MGALDACRRRGDLPVHRGAYRIAGGLERREFVDEGCFSRKTAVPTLAGKAPQFDFRHIQPPPVLRRLVTLPLLPHPRGFRGGKRLVERARFVSSESVSDYATDGGGGITLINPPLPLLGKVCPRPLRGHGNLPPPGLGLTEEKKVAPPVALVFRVVAGRGARLRGQRVPRLADQLLARLLKGYRWAFGIRGLSLQIPHVFPCGHQLAAHCG